MADVSVLVLCVVTTVAGQVDEHTEVSLGKEPRPQAPALIPKHGKGPSHHLLRPPTHGVA